MIFSKQINFPRFWKNLFRMHPNRAAGAIFTFRSRLIDVLEGTCQLGRKLLGGALQVFFGAGPIKTFHAKHFCRIDATAIRAGLWFALPV
jgi:hypothetical protein